MPEEEEVLIFEELPIKHLPSKTVTPLCHIGQLPHVAITSGLGAAEVLRRFGGPKGWIIWITENRWYVNMVIR